MQAVFLNEVKHFWFEKLEKKGNRNFSRLLTEGGLNKMRGKYFYIYFLSTHVHQHIGRRPSDTVRQLHTALPAPDT